MRRPRKLTQKCRRPSDATTERRDNRAMTDRATTDRATTTERGATTTEPDDDRRRRRHIPSAFHSEGSMKIPSIPSIFFLLFFFFLLLFKIRAVLRSFPPFCSQSERFSSQSPPKAPVSAPNHPQTSPKCPNHPQTTPNRPETRPKHTTPPWEREPLPTLRTPHARENRDQPGVECVDATLHLGRTEP